MGLNECNNCEALKRVNNILKKHISILEMQLVVKEKIIRDKEKYISLLTKSKLSDKEVNSVI